MIGQTFNRLTVLAQAPSDPEVGGRRVLCACACGAKVVAFARYLRSGQTKSCGCLHREHAQKLNLKHGHARTGALTPTYLSWQGMIQRCAGLPYRPDREWYVGITVCERWQSFENFLKDMGERPAGKTLDRYPDQKGNYAPINCRWATMKEQAANRKPPRRRASVTHALEAR